jgi:cell division protein ZapA
MGQVNVTVNQRSYTVACGDGEEQHLTELAQYLDKRVGELTEAVGQVGDARLLLMAGLLICDDLSDALEKSKKLKDESATLNAQGVDAQAASNQTEENIANILVNSAKRIEDMAIRLETS